MKIVGRVTTIFDRSLNLMAIFAGVLLIFLMLIISYDIVIRYLAHPTGWAVEISEYVLLWITFLGAAWLLRSEGHVRMDLLLNRLNPRTQALLNVITSIIGATICLIIAWYSVEATWENFRVGYQFAGQLNVPKFTVLLIIPIGSFLLFIQFLRRTNGYLASWRVSSNRQ